MRVPTEPVERRPASPRPVSPDEENPTFFFPHKKPKLSAIFIFFVICFFFGAEPHILHFFQELLRLQRFSHLEKQPRSPMDWRLKDF